MATYTENFNLKKPSNEDFYNIEDFNGNADILLRTCRQVPHHLRPENFILCMSKVVEYV